MSNKRIEELENYNITKAAEGDYIPIVATGDENKTGKCPVSDFRDQMAKINLKNIVTMVLAFLKWLKNANGEGLAAELDRLYSEIVSFTNNYSQANFKTLLSTGIDHCSDNLFHFFWEIFANDKNDEFWDSHTPAQCRAEVKSLLVEGGDLFAALWGIFEDTVKDIISKSDEQSQILNRLSTMEDHITSLERNNGGENENQGEPEPEPGNEPTEEELMTRALALHQQWISTDTTGWTLEQVIADLEQKASVTPADGATLVERLEALEALAAQQAQE